MRPGIARYATTAQLSLEDKPAAHAQTQGAPRLPAELAARRLGADPAVLEAELRGRAHDARQQAAPRGLRLDQAAAVWHVLTSPQTVEVITGPAGTGKSRVLATAARIWDGPVFGTATSQNATNELRAAGIQMVANTTRLLADLKSGRIPPGSLIVADEGSMISITHLAAITEYAARNGCKLVLAGDQEQLAAVEGGGAMTLLADRLGSVQLAEPVRFTAVWERDASLRLRQGDVTALDEYDQHGRICGAPPDQAMDQAAYREIYGYNHPGDPIGPEPSRETPDKRAVWHEAFAALSPICGSDVQTMPDGRLWLIRDTYTAETAWAPRHVGKELRLSRLGVFDAVLSAIRADAEADAARKAGDHARAERHETLAASYRALRDHYQQRKHTLAQAMADRQKWEHATGRTRHLAIAADAELRRRHPGQKIEPLRSAEPSPISDTERKQLHPAPDSEPTETAAWIRDLAAQHQAFRGKVGERQRLRTRGEDVDWGGPGTFASWWAPHWGAILQPPKPEITPSARILELAAEHDTGPEAGD